MTLLSPTVTLKPLFSSSELTGCGYPGLLDRENRSDSAPRWESNPGLPAWKASTLSTRPGSSLVNKICNESFQILFTSGEPGLVDRVLAFFCNESFLIFEIYRFNACAELRVAISTQDGRMHYLFWILLREGASLTR